jgi:hypothetical protein
MTITPLKEVSDTVVVEIAIAGDFKAAVQACREFCEQGLCVTVTPTTYVYTGGAEEGVLVRLINYPRFPVGKRQLEDTARRIANHLRERLFQDSYSIIAQDYTHWHSRRNA